MKTRKANKQDIGKEFTFIRLNTGDTFTAIYKGQSDGIKKGYFDAYCMDHTKTFYSRNVQILISG